MTTAPFAPRHGHPTAALAAAARATPDAPALAFPASGATRTYAGWHGETTDLARGLRALGIEKGTPVALLAENRIEWPLVQLAVAAAGAVLVPLNTHYRREELAVTLARSRASAIVLSARFRSHEYLAAVRALRDELPDLRHVIVLDRYDEAGADLTLDDLAALGREHADRLPAPEPDARAALLFTSGTTGVPKAAVLGHRAMMHNAAATAARLGVTAGDRWTSIIPLFHCAGCIMNLLGCLQAGACYVGVPAFDPLAMFEVIEAERCTLLSGVPTSYLAMRDHPRRADFDLTSLRAGTCGGADCDSELLRDCATNFPLPGLCQVYGQTETATLVSCPAHDDPARFDTAGPPLDGLEVRIADPQSGTPLPAGATGQIEVRGATLMEGYLDDPQATAEVMAADGWLRTGDLGYLREDGRLVIAGGRLRDMIIRGGENIYPAEIEAVLQAHPAVAEVAVFGLADPYYGEVVAAAVRANGAVAAETLCRHAAERLAGFKVPARLFAVDAFPQTASGKIRKTELRDLAAAGQLRELP